MIFRHVRTETSFTGRHHVAITNPSIISIFEVHYKKLLGYFALELHSVSTKPSSAENHVKTYSFLQPHWKNFLFSPSPKFLDYLSPLLLSKRQLIFLRSLAPNLG
eukprot:maker-scaffold_11-snap-gene-1.51-mRNA-1 protein AED:0.17 eAED:0.17 QI:63/1/1/1/0/0/2/572/104